MKTILTVLIVAMAVALAWTLGRAPGEQAALAPPSPVTPGSEEDASPEVDLVAHAREAGAETPAPRTEIPEGVAGISTEPASEAKLEPTTAGSLAVLVVAKETGAPLPGVYLFVRAGEGGDGFQVEWVGVDEWKRAAITDKQGGARCLVSPDVPIRIGAVIMADGARTFLDLEPLARGEERTVRLELPTQPDVYFVGRVLEAEGGAPVAGARVRVLTKWRSLSSTGMRETSQSTGEEVRTGPQGWFETRVASWRNQYGRVDAEGFGPGLFQLERGHEAQERALVVELQRGASLRGIILGAPDFSDFVVRVDARGHEFTSRSGMTLSSLGDVHLQTPVAQDGTWELNDLPPEVGIKLELWRGETRVRSEPERLRLRPGEERSLEWRLGGGTTLLGRAVIADTNEPLAAHSIWLLPASEARGLLQTYTQPVARTTTDDEGRFTFPDLPPGEWSVGPAPSDSWGEPPGKDDVAPVPTRVVIPEGGGTVEVELRVYRGLFIRGEILGLDGERVKNSNVSGYSTASGVWSNRRSSDGAFRLGPLVPGSYELQATGGSETAARSEPVTAMAGDENVVLQLSAGGSIQGRLVNAATGEPVRGTILLVPEENSGLGWTMTHPQLDGSFSFSGLSPGSYTVSGTAGDLVGRVEGVVIGPLQSVEGLEIPLQPGAVLLVTYTGEGENIVYRVTSGDSQLHLDGLVRGRPSRTALPAGRMVVTVEFTGDDGERHEVQRTVDLVVGEEMQVEVGDE